MIDIPWFNWYWIGSIAITLLVLISLGAVVTYFLYPHSHSRN